MFTVPPTWVTTVSALGANSWVLHVSKCPGGNISRELSGEACNDMRACTVLWKGEKKQIKERTRTCTLLFCWPPSLCWLNVSLLRGDSQSLQPNTLKNSLAQWILLLKPLRNNTVWGYYQFDVLHSFIIDYTGIFALYFTELHQMFGSMIELICCILLICIKSNYITSHLALHCIISQCKGFVSQHIIVFHSKLYCNVSLCINFIIFSYHIVPHCMESPASFIISHRIVLFHITS